MRQGLALKAGRGILIAGIGVLAAGILYLGRYAASKAKIHSAPRAQTGGETIPEGSVYRLGSVWTTDAGKKMRLSELKGRVQVVAMMFTNCPSVCPTLIKDMQSLGKALPGETASRTRFLLVSIDPERDTPEALKEYRNRMGLDEGSWTLLQGSQEDIRELAAVLGFSYGKGQDENYAHSRLVTVLGPDGEIAHQQVDIASDPGKIAEAIARAAEP